ncbi:GIY-YIG nuclease family protein [Photobacterium phosphoreum]|uniref:GIY-YIG nuclease family protein n=1 Tax=Photobacterium phosphoreum TaxID=659 RepID=UPI0015E6CD75|nr:GIY-YIG nuclease family protein [Photobacterium phosphoreum]
MARFDELMSLYQDSKLSSIFEIRVEDDYENYSAIRLKPNKFRLRAFELWDANGQPFVRIYHGGKIPESIKAELDSVNGNCKSVKRWSDFRGDFLIIFKEFFEILSSEVSNEIANKSQVYTKNSAYEGLALPDVDTSETDVLGVEFTWKEIIAISEDTSKDNLLKDNLSNSGVYLQRSKDGLSRYVGSAYGDGGMLGRWIKHLNSNGDAKHLNLYVLENGYNNLIFTVLEFTDGAKALSSEQRWKKTLGSKNTGPYDGYRLNRN